MRVDPDYGQEIPPRSTPAVMSIRMEAQLLKELRQLAQRCGVTVSDVMRNAAKEYLEKCRQTPVMVTVRSTSISPPILTTMAAGPSPTEQL